MGRRTIKVVFVGTRTHPTPKSPIDIVRDAVDAIKGDSYWYDSNPGDAVVAFLEAQSGKKKIK